MSLTAESPLHSSSSSDDFAAFLASELELASSDSSPGDENAVDDEENDSHEPRIKRQRIEALEVTEGLEGSAAVVTTQENIGTPLKPLHEIKCPPHPVSYGGLCGICGKLVEDDVSGVPLKYIDKALRLTSSEIDRLRQADLKDLLRKRKLILILDLDHTLLNSVLFAELSSEEVSLLRHADSLLGDPNRSIFKLDNMHLLTKLRPFVRTFLEETSSMFEMYVYTMGKRPYAHEMANLLDPKKVYFNSKVISYDDSVEGHQKGLDVILGAESIIVILDDTHRVWERHKENLILMKRYHFFAASYSKFHINAKSGRELKKDERESDGALATILEVLKHAHRAFYNTDLKTNISSRDIRQVLKGIRREILQECKVFFSATLLYASRELPIWEMAQQLGAICSRELDSSISHIIAVDENTEEARWALQHKKFLVIPDWIEEAYYSWCRQREEDFQISC